MSKEKSLPAGEAGLPAGRQGFTLSELLIVIAIAIIILMLLLINLRTQVNKANDAKRKTDVAKIQKAFEEYYNDTQCYPNSDALSTCEGGQLLPYLKTVPCDPVRKNSYLYVTQQATQCLGYRVCAKLENLNDPDIARIGCHPVDGCGWNPGYNYCLSMGMAAAAPDAELGAGSPTPIPTTSPTPTPVPGNYACSPAGLCNLYANPQQSGCPITYDVQGCFYQGVFQCQFLENRCLQ